MMRYSRIIGHGSYLPERIVTNDEMSKYYDTSDEWIRTRTGIKQRHFAEKNQSTSDLCVYSAQRALKKAGIKPEDIEMTIVATATPDLTFPSTATIVQKKLGLKPGPAHDIQAACAGFLYALSSADAMIQAGIVSNALVIGAEKLSYFMSSQKRDVSVLFGDGAGAVILQAQQAHDQDDIMGILGHKLYADGQKSDILKTDGGLSTTQTYGTVVMNGPELFRHAVTNLTHVSQEIMKKLNFSIDDIDWMIPHQANYRILNAVAKQLNFDPEKIIITVDQHANTSAASIPLAMDKAALDGCLKNGDTILLNSMGAGLTWGASMLKWWSNE